MLTDNLNAVSLYTREFSLFAVDFIVLFCAVYTYMEKIPLWEMISLLNLLKYYPYIPLCRKRERERDFDCVGISSPYHKLLTS